MKLVLATANPDKAEEIRFVLRDAGVDVDLVGRPAGVPEVDETGETLEENARLKAVALCDATGLPAVADDTGLSVDALFGAPGVYSARFAGEHATYADNVAKLLARAPRRPRPGAHRPVHHRGAGPVARRARGGGHRRRGGHHRWRGTG